MGLQPDRIGASGRVDELIHHRSPLPTILRKMDPRCLGMFFRPGDTARIEDH